MSRLYFLLEKQIQFLDIVILINTKIIIKIIDLYEY